MPVETLPMRRPPEYMLPLIAAHDWLLHESYEFFASLQPELATKDGLLRPGNAIVYVLFAKLIQYGRAVQFLVANGYTDEAEPPARAMVSAALSLVGIADGEPDARALRFMEQSREIRAQLIDGYVKEGYAQAEEVAARDAEWRKEEDALLTRYAEQGITPAKIADANKYTWHGLSDYRLALAMNASRWYHLYYRNFSDEAHANVAAVTRTLRLLVDHKTIKVGPSFNDPWMVVSASADTIGECLSQLDTLYNLGRRAEIDAINERFADALRQHRSVMPDPTSPISES